MAMYDEWDGNEEEEEEECVTVQVECCVLKKTSRGNDQTTKRTR